MIACLILARSIRGKNNLIDSFEIERSFSTNILILLIFWLSMFIC